MTIPGYIITLERAVHRRPQVERLAAASRLLACETVAAVEGAKLPAAEVASVYRRRLHRPHYPFTLNMAEIGCFLSHRQVWSKIVDSGAEVGLVSEDDVELQQPGFDAALTFALQHLQPGDYGRFHVRSLHGVASTMAADDVHQLVWPEVAPLGTQLQLVTRDAAQKLLAATESFDRPVDVFLQMTWLTGVPIKAIVPACAVEVSANLGGSTISGKKSLWNRLSKEIQRPWYRSQVARLSKRTYRQAS